MQRDDIVDEDRERRKGQQVSLPLLVMHPPDLAPEVGRLYTTSVSDQTHFQIHMAGRQSK